MRKAPVLKASYAPEKVSYGDPLRVYIEAEAAGEDMLRIASVVDQAGYGRYPTDWIYLKSEYQQYFRGYLQWNTLSPSPSNMSEWTQITLKISVFDKAGTQSNAVVFPLLFVSEAIPVSSPPLPFHEGDPRIGYLDINLTQTNLVF